MLDAAVDWIIYQRLPITIIIAIIAYYCFNYALDLRTKIEEGGYAFMCGTLLMLITTFIWFPDA